MCPGLPWSEKSKWSRDQSKVLGKRGRMLPKCSFSIFTSVNIQPCAYILYMFSFRVVLLIKVKQFDTSEQTSLEGMFTSQVDTKTKFIRFRWLPISKFAFRNIFGWSSPIIEHDLNSDKELSPKIFWLWTGDWFTMRGVSRIVYNCIAGWKCLFYSK